MRRVGNSAAAAGKEELMDRRVEELKYLKKAYRREKRTATALWKWLFVLSLADCVLFAPFAAQAFLPGFPVTYWAELGISFALDFDLLVPAG